MVCWSPYGRTITSPAEAQWRSSPSTSIQQVPVETTWNRITRSVPGLSSAAVAGPESDWYAQGSRYSARRKIAPASRNRSSAATKGSDSDGSVGVLAARSVSPVARSWPADGLCTRLIVTQRHALCVSRQGASDGAVHGCAHDGRAGRPRRRRAGSRGGSRHSGAVRRELPALLGRRVRGQDLLPRRGSRRRRGGQRPPRGPRSRRGRDLPGGGGGLRSSSADLPSATTTGAGHDHASYPAPVHAVVRDEGQAAGPLVRTSATWLIASRSSVSQSSSCWPTSRTHHARASALDRATPASTRVSSTCRCGWRRRVMVGEARWVYSSSWSPILTPQLTVRS